MLERLNLPLIVINLFTESRDFLLKISCVVVIISVFFNPALSLILDQAIIPSVL
jgi:hypothetical protein